MLLKRLKHDTGGLFTLHLTFLRNKRELDGATGVSVAVVVRDSIEMKIQVSGSRLDFMFDIKNSFKCKQYSKPQSAFHEDVLQIVKTDDVN